MKRGIPRPRTKIGRSNYGAKWADVSFPHPYAANEGQRGIASIDRGRNKECVKFKRCMNCGEPVKEEIVGLILYADDSSDYSDFRLNNNEWLHRESGPFHTKCLIMSMTMCPHIVNKDRFIAATGPWKVVRKIILSRF